MGLTTHESKSHLHKWEEPEEEEYYERLTLKRAWAIFNGGQGGTLDDPVVGKRLFEAVRPLGASSIPADDEDPFLADLIWWKGDQFVVVEVSLRVKDRDVIWATQRAEMLRRAGARAMGVVIGEEWAEPDVRRQAEAMDVHWKVGDDLAEGLIAFRQLPS